MLQKIKSFRERGQRVLK